MKHFKPYILAVVLMVTASCDYIANYDKPHLELSTNPYQLDITKFAWSYGLTEINKFNGNFDKLDEKVYDLLKGKSGLCRINIQSNRIDTYGKPDLTMNYVGDINIDELNKYQDWKYWQKVAGIKTLLYRHFISPQSMDSTRIDTVESDSVHTDTAKPVIYSRKNINTVPQPTYEMFSIDQLYTTEVRPSTLEENRYIINGTIGEVYFDSDLFQIITTDGDRVAIHIYASRASVSTASRLRNALQTGRTIRCVAEQTDPNTYDLLAAKILNN